MLLVLTEDWNAVSGTLQRFSRVEEKWLPVGKGIDIVVGVNGLGWGQGIMTPPLDMSGHPSKKEGDGKAPAGVFHLSHVFGYAASELFSLPYIKSTSDIFCIDDVNSKFYNQLVDVRQIAQDWKSHEFMLRSDELYKWGAVIAHNTSPVTAGKGSCIFLHIWGGAGAGTLGCTAMEEADLLKVLQWLNVSDHPIIVQLPKPVYHKLKPFWFPE